MAQTECLEMKTMMSEMKNWFSSEINRLDGEEEKISKFEDITVETTSGKSLAVFYKVIIQWPFLFWVFTQEKWKHVYQDMYIIVYGNLFVKAPNYR